MPAWCFAEEMGVNKPAGWPAPATRGPIPPSIPLAMAHPASTLRAVSLTRDPAAAVSWRSVPGTIYQVEWCASLDGPWLDTLPASRVLAEDEIAVFNDPTTGSDSWRFYRIKSVAP